ncbi:hypothetical protein HYDPIDRAFT_51702, partial [Hydnomerulius pinastri MD-312]
AISKWQTEWEPEAEWDRNFNIALRRAQEKAWRGTDKFFRGCESHAREGRSLLRQLQRVAQTLGAGRIPREHLVDKYLQVFDLIVVLMSEVKFFEVKLHEYAPSIPLSKVSEI